MLPILILPDPAPESAADETPLEANDAEIELGNIRTRWELSPQAGRRARVPLGPWIEIRHRIPSVTPVTNAAPASLKDCDQFLKLLMRRRADSLGRRQRAELRMTLHTAGLAPSSIATLSAETATWLLWAMSWRGVSTVRQLASPPLHPSTLRHSMVDRYAGGTVLRSCGYAFAGVRRLRRAAVPILGTHGRANSRLGDGFARSADGPHQVHAADVGRDFHVRDRPIVREFANE